MIIIIGFGPPGKRNPGQYVRVFNSPLISQKCVLVLSNAKVRLFLRATK